MKNRWKRLLAAALALALAGSSALPAAGAGTAEDSAGREGSGALLDVATGSYSPDVAAQPGALYTLIALPLESDPPQVLTAGDLAAASGSALFIGSAVADAQGKLTFQDVRLRTAQTAVYYVTGPGLEPPYREAANGSTSVQGRVIAAGADASADITLVDSETDYHYNAGLRSDASGAYATGSIVPGRYKFRVEKPGYLPTESAYLELPDGETAIQDLDISGNVGDVDNDGDRDMDDLAALLLYHGGAAPEGITADLDGNGAVDDGDAALLAPHLPTGQAPNVGGAAIRVQDGGGADTEGLRSLVFSLETDATVSAAAFSLTLQRQAVQPMTAQGGLMSPSDGSVLDNCLSVADGYAVRLVSWKVEEETATLSFAVTAQTPHAAGEVARFYYRPASGSTQSFYHGVFELAHAVALVGKDTVAVQSELTYPNCDEILLDSISIDQKPAAGGEAVSLTIPSAGRTAVLPLSATGRGGSGDVPGLQGVRWFLPQNCPGVSVSRGLLTVTAAASEGTVTVRAGFVSGGQELTDDLTVTLKKAPSAPAAVEILKDGFPCVLDVLAFTAGEEPDAVYTARVYDQYGEPMADGAEVTWSLFGAPVGLAVEDGRLSADWDKLPAGDSFFTLCAQTEDGLQATAEIYLTVEVKLGALILTGPTSVVLPAPDGDPLTLYYSLSALDEQGRPMKPDQANFSFGIDPMADAISIGTNVSGVCSVVILPREDMTGVAGSYTLTARCGEVSATLTLELLPPERSAASRAVIFADDVPVESAQLVLDAGGTGEFSYTAWLLDALDQRLDEQSEAWEWALSDDAPEAVALSGQGAAATLLVEGDLAAGSYPFTLTATETDSGLAVSVRVILTVRPVLATLALSAPGSLVIPTGSNLSYTLPLAAFDAQGEPMALPDELDWSVAEKGAQQRPAGVDVSGGVLIVSPAALPGDITVTVSSGEVSAAADITLKPAGQERVLTLYRQISVDGEIVSPSAPVSVDGDDFFIKEGQTAQIAYTAMLVEQSSGEAAPVDPDQVALMGGSNVFTVDGKALSGVYTASLTAVYDGQSDSAAAQVTVYPNITGLHIDFGQDGGLEPPYTLGVPAGASKTYTGRLIATIRRNGQDVRLPLNQLDLGFYLLEAVSYYTGVYLAVDETAGLIHCTVDPVAIQNPMDEPYPGEADIRVLDLSLTLLSGETQEWSLPLFLEKEELAPRNAYIRRGVGLGADFSFDTPQDHQVTAPVGTLSNCYALELMDQYNRPLVSQDEVRWDLTVTPSAQDGITLIEAGQSLERAYPNYSSIRRLRVSSDTPAGTYRLTLSATCGAFTRSLNITLEVVPPDPGDRVITLSEGGQVTIPRYYYQYNSTTLNTQVNTFPFALTLRTGDGYELDPSSCTVSWSVTGRDGTAPTGVSVVKTSPSTADVQVDRSAQPTGSDSDDLLRVTAAVTGPDGGVETLTSQLELVRGASVPTVMEVYRNGSAITRDSIIMTSTDTVTRTYSFRLWDQYAQDASLNDRRQVQWRLSNVADSGVTASVVRDSDQILSAQVTITKPTKSVTVNLTAVITFTNADTAGSQVSVYATIPLVITVNSSSSSDKNNGGGGGGGGGLDSETETAGVPASLTISGGSILSATEGTAATKTFSATLRDSKGLTCSLSYQSKITWSASGLSGGITFDKSTRVLTVPATTAPGTYSVTITAAYSSSVRQSITVTITVKAKDAASSSATDVTLAPQVTQTGTSGSASLTTAQEQALLAANAASGGTVSIVPTGGSGLSSLSVSLTSATAAAIASQRSQSLRIQTVLGTVLLSPEALRALATRGGSTVTVTLSAAADTLKVDFACGSTALSLPGVVILNGYASGNVAFKVNADGSQTLLKKALVQDGKVYTYLTGSTQLKLETRAPVFDDVQNHWAQASIRFTASRELFQGVSANAFSPGGNMTRGMVVTVLHRLEDAPTAAQTAQFSDVEAGAWYTAAVAWANAEDIVQGTGSGFRPNDPVTREQLAAILYRYVNALGLTLGGRGDLSAFSDQSEVSSWAREAMEWAVGVGLINGKTGGVLDPGGYATRAEVSAILERVIRAMAPTV